MRHFALLLLAAVSAIAFTAWAATMIGCTPLDNATTFARAKNMLGECGVMLPLLESDTCTGAAEEISKCIVTTNGSCDALATLGKNLNQCISTDGGEIPDDFPQIDAYDSGFDGGTVDISSIDASSSGDAGTAIETSDASTPIPAGVFDVTGTIGLGEMQSFSTSRLAVGTYSFSFTTNGALDLYVRKGYAPTTTTFDCETSDPSTPCSEVVASSAILYVLVVGEAGSSTFSVDAQP